MALRAHFERPVTAAEIDRAVGPGSSPAADGASRDERRRRARRGLELVRRLRFHLAAWVLALAVLLPLNALIEWQDNGAFERLGGDSQPGSWEPWALYVGGFWALGIALVLLVAYLDRPQAPRRGGAWRPGSSE